MKEYSLGLRVFVVGLACLVATSQSAEASVFVGDLVYCDLDANGVFNGVDVPLNGVQVRVTCGSGSEICFDVTTTTGTIDASAQPELDRYNDRCSEVATFDPTTGPLDGRYLVELVGNRGEPDSGCVENAGGEVPLPWTCTITVLPSSLPSDCNVPVTPVVGGFPVDGSLDGDLCDADDGPFPEDQVLGNTPLQGGCENFPDPLPGDGVYSPSIDVTFPAAPDTCSMHNDFGYTMPVGGEGCTPGYWKNHLSQWFLDPGADFDTTFGVDFFDPDITLGEAINLGGGGTRKLARHGTAALLNVANPSVNYPLTEPEVIAAVQAGDANLLVEFNELSDECPAQ